MKEVFLALQDYEAARLREEECYSILYEKLQNARQNNITLQEVKAKLELEADIDNDTLPSIS